MPPKPKQEDNLGPLTTNNPIRVIDNWSLISETQIQAAYKIAIDGWPQQAGQN
jgi:hypothetical protein